MPLKYFICPDAERIEVSDCLKEGNCRLGQRCAFRSYLQMAGRQRPWTGKPSTTQLIKGTMEAFLEITNEYAVSPDSRAFMINGTRGHARLEGAGESDECSMLEVKFSGDDVDVSGIADVIEIENGRAILGDNKVSGSYKLQKALGFTVIKEDTGEVYKSGKKAGQAKTRNVMVRDTTKADTTDWELQLNQYRIQAEKAGIHIDELRIQVIVRDGNTMVARSRGVFRNVYNFKIPIWPDKLVMDYFERKRIALETALKQGYWTEICTKEENWDSLKCQKYCAVAEFCSYGKYLHEQKVSEDMAIKGLSEVRRLPRVGKIRLGEKKKNANGKEYPVEIDYFKLDPQTPVPEENKRLMEIYHQKYGEFPKSLPIMFPVCDLNVIFPQFYKRYGSGSGLQCRGDGEKAMCMSEQAAQGLKILKKNGVYEVECKGRECPYYLSKKCTESATLQVLLPELPGAGVWQITTGSYNSIVNINSCLDYVRAVAGRINMIPLTLERRTQEITHEGKKRNHYIMHISMDIPLAQLQRLATIDPAKALLELPPVEEDKEDILFQENKIEAEAIVLPVQNAESDVAKADAECKAAAKRYATAFDLVSQKIHSTAGDPDMVREAKAYVARKVTMVEEITKPLDLTVDQWDMLTRLCETEQDTIESLISAYLDIKNN